MVSAVMRSSLVLILALIAIVHASKRFQDVMEFGGRSRHDNHQSQIHGWSSDSSSWDEKLYPAWKSRDPRWENCWKGGKVVAHLTSDSPALVGSNVTFAVTLQFPRCQKENEDGDIVYERLCGNASFSNQDQYVYNWTKWVDYCDEGNCSFVSKFPDGRPFPHHHDWRRHNFIYIFRTQGQYYQKLGRSSAILSINTTNITVGAQTIEVSVFRKGWKRHYPVAKASGMYIITDQIPFYVNISQKNNKNSSDGIFIKDSPITFDVRIHDPSHYLNKSILSFNWSFGDGSGLFVSNNPVLTHTYTLLGNFSANLTIKAAIPGPCKPVTPTPLPTTHAPTTPLPTTTTTPTTASTTSTTPTTTASTTSTTTANTTGNATDLLLFEDEDFLVSTEEQNVTTTQTTVQTTSAPGCFIYRYGYYNATITVVDGILNVNIIEMTKLQMLSEAGDSLIDFVVSCEGGLPTDACTTVLDASCMIPQNMVCDQIPASDQCLLTLRRTFPEPGSYCVNITLSDGASLALASTLVSVDGGKYREYKPIISSADEGGNRISVYFTQVKDIVFRGNPENAPLLKNNAVI